jgi:hypothetical protein
MASFRSSVHDKVIGSTNLAISWMDGMASPLLVNTVYRLVACQFSSLKPVFLDANKNNFNFNKTETSQGNRRVKISYYLSQRGEEEGGGK